MKNDVAAYLARFADGKHDGLPDPVIVSAEPSASFARQLQLVGVVRHSLALIGAHALATVFLLLSWYFLGSAALAGRADAGWLTAWAIALACTVPLRAVSRWLEGVVAAGQRHRPSPERSAGVRCDRLAGGDWCGAGWSCAGGIGDCSCTDDLGCQ
jgi:hypothetical protein